MGKRSLSKIEAEYITKKVQELEDILNSLVPAPTKNEREEFWEYHINNLVYVRRSNPLNAEYALELYVKKLKELTKLRIPIKVAAVYTHFLAKLEKKEAFTTSEYERIIFTNNLETTVGALRSHFSRVYKDEDSEYLQSIPPKCNVTGFDLLERLEKGPAVVKLIEKTWKIKRTTAYKKQ